ncbi:MAG TPA: AI-2E family transporter, partial [Bacteroidales bacterium]|nr:AI-2E family transporter [Bacteroidales bacterium]
MMRNITNRYPLAMRIAFTLLAVILFFYAVIAAKDFLYPIVLGVLFGYLLYPAACFFEKHGAPRILANLLSILIFLLAVGAGLFFIYKQAGSFIDDFPVYKLKALANIDRLENAIEQRFGMSDLRLVDFFRIRVRHLFDVGNTMMNRTFTSTAGTLFRLGILPVFMFLFLFYRTKLAIFILKLVPSEKKLRAVRVLKEFARVVPSYMGGVSTVVLILAVIN